MQEETTIEAVDLLSGTFWGGDPYPALAALRRAAPVYRDEPNGLWGITRYQDVRRISGDPRTFSSAEGARPDAPAMPMMIDLDDPEHHRRRGLVGRGFTPRQVSLREDRVRAICDDILDRVAEHGACDFVRDIAAPLPMRVIGELMGFPSGDGDRLLAWSDEMIAALGAPDPAAMDRATVAFAEYRAYLQPFVEDRRRTGDASDLIGIFVNAEIDGERLDNDALAFEIVNLLIGGDETTRHVITGGMYELLRHPGQRELLRADRSALPTAVEEMLRWVSPIKGMARTATRDVEVRGMPIAAGERVLLLYPSANRDEDVFEEPDRFDVRRTPNEHVAFGYGAHFCLGNSLARLELRVMFDRLLERFPDMELASEDPLPVRQANFITGFEAMPVTFTPTA
ncbi:MAG: cytochrome P450 [Actinobacteria bacterium]|nr:cytochrome P450 [Actinomycetota bacterium]